MSVAPTLDPLESTKMKGRDYKLATDQGSGYCSPWISNIDLLDWCGNWSYSFRLLGRPVRYQNWALSLEYHVLWASMLKMDYLIVLLPEPPVINNTGIKCQPRRLHILVASRRDNEHIRSTSIHSQMMRRQFCCIGGFEVTGGHSSVSAFFSLYWEMDKGGLRGTD